MDSNLVQSISWYFDVALQARTDLVTSCDCRPGHVDQLIETRCQLMLSFNASLAAQIWSAD